MKTFIIHTKKKGKIQHAIIKAHELVPVTSYEARVNGVTVLRVGGSEVLAVSQVESEEEALAKINKWHKGPSSWAAIAAWTGRLLSEV